MDHLGTLQTTIENKIATVSFHHPAGNSFPSHLLQKLTAELNTLSTADDVLIIVLKSEGSGAFCGGASFDELVSINDLENGTRFFSGFANVINAMRKCSKLIVGRIHGKAVGGGVGLASACDYTFATKSASIKLSELAVGIGPFVIAPAVKRKMGLKGLTEMTLNPQLWKSAEWAFDEGLYAVLFDDEKQMDQEISEFCNRLADYNPEALAEMKKVFWKETDHWGTLLYERAAISGSLVLSDYTKSFLAEFRKS